MAGIQLKLNQHEQRKRAAYNENSLCQWKIEGEYCILGKTIGIDFIISAAASDARFVAADAVIEHVKKCHGRHLTGPESVNIKRFFPM
ncbi:hypothetical protein [Piscirickettsia litoralis]|uniref:DUF1059 domain-containing protein n=1 Tax=Piscirickettsia litoralis TaxID=1891921 RepID=A0ABX3A7J8_9GAMM|nr:hypothetical protein [Piscirickettsia litoralis]ODN42074.1 hypothetical protein BGC07_02780 [Piscirickettsia litoralis]